MLATAFASQLSLFVVALALLSSIRRDWPSALASVGSCLLERATVEGVIKAVLEVVCPWLPSRWCPMEPRSSCTAHASTAAGGRAPSATTARRRSGCRTRSGHPPKLPHCARIVAGSTMRHATSAADSFGAPPLRTRRTNRSEARPRAAVRSGDEDVGWTSLTLTEAVAVRQARA